MQAFKGNFRFIVCISIIYELLLMCHAIAVLRLLGLQTYGLIGSLLSIIHMSTHLADWGMTNSISPHLHLFLQSKQSWRKLFFNYTLIPHAPIIMLTAIGTIFFVGSTTLSISSTMLCLLFILITLDTIQSFMRQFLYALFKTTTTATTELILLLARLLILWGIHFGTSISLSLELIMWSHLASTIICLALFSIQLFKQYRILPDSVETFPQYLVWRLLSSRISNYFLRLTRNVFTSHFLTPLFAIQFGLKTAGIFFFASKLAKTVQAAVKLSIGYSGNGVLAHVKNEPLAVKSAAFTMLGTKLLDLVIPALALFIPLTAGAVHCGYVQSPTQQIVTLSLLFLFITFFEFFFMLYEQWYILEEAAHNLFFIKLCELIVLLCMIKFLILSPTYFLEVIIIMRLIHFGLIALHAYARWRIALTYQLNIHSCTWYAALGCFCWYFFL